jgi:hypothetical protein
MISSSIIVSVYESAFRPDNKRTRVVDYAPDMTIRSLMPDDILSEPFIAFRNGKPVEDESNYDRALVPGDVVAFLLKPATGVDLVAIGVSLLISAVTFVVSLLIGPTVKAPTTVDEEESATYGFNNLRVNPTQEGAAKPVVYGRHVVAPQLINIFTTSVTDPSITFLHMLFAIGHGPVNKIGNQSSDADGLAALQVKDIWINDQDISTFKEVEVAVRTGSLEQAKIVGFEDAVVQDQVGQTLLNPSATGTTASTGGVYTTSTVPTWPDAVTYTADADADEFTVIVEFPQGLYTSSTTQAGAIDPNEFRCQIRVREVDGGGSPIGDYLVYDEESPVIADINNKFRVEFRHPFFDIAGAFIPPSFGESVKYGFPATTPPYMESATPFSVTYPQQPKDTLEFSIVGWAKFDFDVSVAGPPHSITWDADTGPVYTIGAWPLWSQIYSSDTKGVEVIMQNSGGSGAIAPGLLAPGLTMRVNYGDGSTIRVLTGGSGVSIPANVVNVQSPVTNTSPAHFMWAITYKGFAEENGNARLRMYVGGVGGVLKVADHSIVPAQKMDWDPNQVFKMGEDYLGTQTISDDTEVDETTVWERELSLFDLQSIHGDYNPQQVAVDSFGLLYGMRFDAADKTGLPTTQIARDFVADAIKINKFPNGPATGGPDTVPFGTPLPDAIGGIVTIPLQGTEKRARYRIEVQRTNTEDEGTLSFDQAVWQEVKLRTFEDFQYPTTALLGIKIRATDQLQGSAPNVTALVEGALVPVWDQASTSVPVAPPKWSRNPVWIAVDLLTNTTYGLGRDFDLTNINLEEFQALADRCDELVYDLLGKANILDATETFATDGKIEVTVPGVAEVADFGYKGHWLVGLRVRVDNDTGTPANTTWHMTAGKSGTITALTPNAQAGFPLAVKLTIDATGAYSTAPSTWVDESPTFTTRVEGVDERFRFDGVFDSTQQTAWDALVQILQTAWAAPIQIGNEVSVFYDRARQPVALVGMGDIVQGSFRQEFSGIANRPNSIDVEYLDENDRYRRTFVSADHPNVQDPANFDTFRRKRIATRGIVRRSQAARHAIRDLNINFLIRRSFQWQMGVDGIPLIPGDVVRLAHDVPGYGTSGRIRETSTAANVVKLDRDITIAAATSYSITIQNASLGLVETVGVDEVTTGTGTHVAGTAITMDASFGFMPQRGDLATFGVVNADSKLVAIANISFDPDTMLVTVEAIEYDEDVYDESAVAEVDPTITNLDVPAPQLILASVVDPSAEGSRFVDETGHTQKHVHVSWTYENPDSLSLSGANIYVSTGRNGDPRTEGRTPWRLVGRTQGKTTRFVIPNEQIDNTSKAMWVSIAPETVGGARPDPDRGTQVPVVVPSFVPEPGKPGRFTTAMRGDRAVYDVEQENVAMRAIHIRRGGFLDADGVPQGGWILAHRVGDLTARARRSLATLDWVGSPANSVGWQAPLMMAAGRVTTGQYTNPRYTEFNASAQDITTIAYEASLEDETPSPWGSTLSGFQEDTSTTPSFIKFDASSTSGALNFTLPALKSAQRVYLQAYWAVDQDPPYTIQDLEDDGFGFDILEFASLTFEGFNHDDAAGVTFDVEVRTTRDSSAPSGSWQPFVPGPVYMRRAEFRITATRPDTTWDFRLYRFAVRVTRIAPVQTDHLAIEVFS